MSFILTSTSREKNIGFILSPSYVNTGGWVGSGSAEWDDAMSGMALTARVGNIFTGMAAYGRTRYMCIIKNWHIKEQMVLYPYLTDLRNQLVDWNQTAFGKLSVWLRSHQPMHNQRPYKRHLVWSSTSLNRDERIVLSPTDLLFCYLYSNKVFFFICRYAGVWVIGRVYKTLHANYNTTYHAYLYFNRFLRLKSVAVYVS